MYTPKLYDPPSGDELLRVIRQNSFGVLVTAPLMATHIPMELEILPDGSYCLFGHLAKANPHSGLLHEREGMAIFNGPHTYISSSWYEKINVPTWNYIAVHVHGIIKVLSEEESVKHMKMQLGRYEQQSKKPVTMEAMPPKFLSSHMNGIVAFRMFVKNIEGSFKLSQNRNDRDYFAIVDELQKRDDDQSQHVAEEMLRIRPKNT